MQLPAHKTRIVATIGPATDEQDLQRQLILAGLNVARLNFSHGSFDEHAARIRSLRSAAEAAERDIAIMADLPGPKMRIGLLAEEPVELIADQPFTLVGEEIVGDITRASTTFPRLAQVVKPGDMLYLNDGLIQLEVIETAGADVHSRILVGGELWSRKGLNLPGIDLGMSAFTERDRECLEFALANGVDAVSQSFVESAADIDAVRAAAESLGKQPFIIAKIERAGALDHLDEIIAAADGIMIARGDLGVEVPIEHITTLQKSIIKKTVRAAKPVITATQMLESMIRSRQPTRAEATDVANAILDGTDCVMLSGESAMGRFPLEAVRTLARIAGATETSRPQTRIGDLVSQLAPDLNLGVGDLFGLSIEVLMAGSQPGAVAAVVVPTRSGTTGRKIGRFRLPVWIASPTESLATCRGLMFSYGIQPLLEQREDLDWNDFVRNWVKENDQAGRAALLVRGPSHRNPGANHSLEIVELDPDGSENSRSDPANLR